MRYFKLLKVVDEITTKSLIVNESEELVIYCENNNGLFVGVNTEDENFLQKQHPECEVAEMSFEEINPMLSDCKMMNDFNRVIEAIIVETKNTIFVVVKYIILILLLVHVLF